MAERSPESSGASALQRPHTEMAGQSATNSAGKSELSIDKVLLIALAKSEDRQFVLDSESMIQALLEDPKKTSFSFLGLNSYRRRIVHMLAEYYRVTHVPNKYSRNDVILYKEEYSAYPQTTLEKLAQDIACDNDESSAEDEGKMEQLNVTKIMTRRKPPTSPETGQAPDGRRSEPAERATEATSRNSSRNKAYKDKSIDKCCTRMAAIGIASKTKSMEEREAEYERARAEIFRGEDDNGDSDGSAADDQAASEDIAVRPQKRGQTSMSYQKQQQQPNNRHSQHSAQDQPACTNGVRPSRPHRTYCNDQTARPSSRSYSEHQPPHSSSSSSQSPRYTQQSQSYRYYQPQMRPQRQLFDPNSGRIGTNRGQQPQPQPQQRTQRYSNANSPTNSPSSSASLGQQWSNANTPSRGSSRSSGSCIARQEQR